MKSKHFLIPSLLAAGFATGAKDVDAAIVPNDDDIIDPEIGKQFALEHDYHLAGHRSHSSHGSHRSHRSSSGGGYSPSPSPTVPSTRNQRSTPPTSVLPRTPAITSKPKTLPGNSEAFKDIARRVQAALYARGYYTGALDGLVGPQTRSALSQFQRDSGLNVSGTIDSATLNALQITAR